MTPNDAKNLLILMVCAIFVGIKAIICPDDD